jgi:hypothetical protein
MHENMASQNHCEFQRYGGKQRPESYENKNERQRHCRRNHCFRVAMFQRKPNERHCHYEAAVFAMPHFITRSCDIARTFHSRSCTGEQIPEIRSYSRQPIEVNERKKLPIVHAKTSSTPPNQKSSS